MDPARMAWRTWSAWSGNGLLTHGQQWSEVGRVQGCLRVGGASSATGTRQNKAHELAPVAAFLISTTARLSSNYLRQRGPDRALPQLPKVGLL